MKRFMGLFVIIAAVLFANGGFAAPIDNGIIPQDTGFIVISGNTTQLFQGLQLIIGNDSDDLESLEKFSAVVDNKRMIIVNFDMTLVSNYVNGPDFDSDDMGDFLDEAMCMVIPINRSFEDAVNYVGSDSENLEEVAPGVFRADDTYLKSFSTGAGLYVVAASEESIIDSFINSKKLTSNPTASSQDLVKFLSENKEHPVAYFLSGSSYASWKVLQENMFEDSGSLNDQMESFMKIFQQYDFSGSLRYSEGYIDRLEYPVNVVMRTYMKPGVSFLSILNPVRNYGAGFLDSKPLIYAEVDLQPAFIKEALIGLGFLEGEEITREQLDQAIQAINGTFAAAAYESGEGLNNPPNIIGFIGLNRRDYAELLLAMLIEYDKITISGQQVLEVYTMNQQYSRLYVLIDKKDMVVSTSKDLLTLYIKNMLRGTRPFAQYLTSPSGYYRPFYAGIFSKELINLFFASMLGGQSQPPSNISISCDIAQDGSVVEFKLVLE